MFRDKAPVAIKWFEGSLTNLSFNCLDRHVAAGRGSQLCFIWEGNDEEDVTLKLTYSEVLDKVCKMANVLKSMGVGRGAVLTHDCRAAHRHARLRQDRSNSFRHVRRLCR